MKKQVVFGILWSIFGVGILGIGGIVTGFVLGAFDLVSFLAFGGVALTATALDTGLLIYFAKRFAKKKDEPEEKPKTAEEELISLYTLLGIPIQYNKDGSIMDIYQLLGIDVNIDENGKLLPTIYEILGLAPKFDKDGKEIPTVFAIKNGVKKVAKVDMSERVLTRKITDKEKEELEIKETLKKKLEEAKKAGDVEKQKAIEKVVSKGEPKKEDEYKPLKYTSSAGKNTVKPSSQKAPGIAVDGLKALFAIGAVSALAKAATSGAKKDEPSSPPPPPRQNGNEAGRTNGNKPAINFEGSWEVQMDKRRNLGGSYTLTGSSRESGDSMELGR